MTHVDRVTCVSRKDRRVGRVRNAPFLAKCGLNSRIGVDKGRVVLTAFVLPLDPPGPKPHIVGNESRRDHPVSKLTRYVLLSGAVLVLAGCQTTPTSPPAPASELQLIRSQPLVIAPDCEASGSFFVEFSVLSDGRTGKIQAPQGPACVQQALTAWISSFQYSPPGRDTQSGVEWMMVTASKGP